MQNRVSFEAERQKENLSEQLKGICLFNSFIERVHLHKNLEISISAVLLTSHPHFIEYLNPPKVCSKHGTLIFENVRRLVTTDFELDKVFDSDSADSYDYGFIQDVSIEDDHFVINGDFGTLQVWADNFSLPLGDYL